MAIRRPIGKSFQTVVQPWPTIFRPAHDGVVCHYRPGEPSARDPTRRAGPNLRYSLVELAAGLALRLHRTLQPRMMQLLNARLASKAHLILSGFKKSGSEQDRLGLLTAWLVSPSRHLKCLHICMLVGLERTDS